MLFYWFKILKNLEEKRGKNEGEIHAILSKYSFPVSRMESEGTILHCASNYMKENDLSLLSQLLEKGSTKLDSGRKVIHADILIKLGQKGFPNRDFQSEAYIPSSISTDTERKFIALRQLPVIIHS